MFEQICFPTISFYQKIDSSILVNQQAKDQSGQFNQLIWEYYSQLMYEEQQKKTKLVSVINDLTSIKQQLHLLMSPASEERTSDSILKSTNPKSKQALSHQLDAQRSDRLHHFYYLQEKIIKESPRKVYEKNGLTDLSKKSVKKQSQQKDEKQVMNFQIKKQLQRKKDSFPANKPNDNKKSHQALKFVPKQNRSRPIKNAFIDLVTPTQLDDEKEKRKHKQFSHYRHSSQRDLSKGNNCSNINFINNPKVEKQFINQQKIQEKQFFLLKKNINITPQNTKVKKLRRMKSDLIDHSQAFNHYCIPQQVKFQGNNHQYVMLKEKLASLQKQNAEKQGIIRILEAQLKEIQTAFIEMKLSITKIIKIGSSSHKNIKEAQLNEALKQIIHDLQLQQQQIKRLTIDSQTWRKLNFQQSLIIKSNKEELQQYGKANQTINELKEQNNRYKDQILNITSKLQVSNSENRLKDEFIIKFLIGKSLPQKNDSKISQIIHILQNYLKTCSYPNNKLMQKLNQEQNQIKKLKSLIEKDRKNSL